MAPKETDSIMQADEIPSTEPANPEISFDVGERRFHSSYQTLTKKSSYFRNLLQSFNSVRVHSSDHINCFIDRDPALFEHVLRYLRSDIFPVFYDIVKGHDRLLYFAMAQEAKFYGLEALQTWIQEKRYLEAVKAKIDYSMLDEAMPTGDAAGGEYRVDYHPLYKTESVYICPRRIELHRGDPSRCGRQCNNARGGRDPEYVDEDSLQIVRVARRPVINPAAFLDESS